MQVATAAGHSLCNLDRLETAKTPTDGGYYSRVLPSLQWVLRGRYSRLHFSGAWGSRIITSLGGSIHSRKHQVREAVIHSVLKFLIDHFFAFAPFLRAFLRRIFWGRQQSRSKVGIDISDERICLVELSWQRASPFCCWASLHLPYKGVCACRNGLNRLCLKLTGHYIDPLMLTPNLSRQRRGFGKLHRYYIFQLGRG